MICTSCENNFPETATFCPFCGEEAPRHVTTMLGGLRADAVVEEPETDQFAVDEEDVDAHWETLLGGFEADATVAGESVVRDAAAPKKIVHDTVILGEQSEKTAAPFNHTLVGELLREPARTQTAVMGPVEDVEDFRSGRRLLTRGAIVAALAVAVVAGVYVGSWLSDQISTAGVTAEPAVASVPHEVEEQQATPRPELSVRRLQEGFEILVGDEVVHTVTTAEGSRYETVADRARSIDVRLQHVSDQEEGSFHARIAGDHWELVFRQDDSDFRILDVTEADAEASGTSVDLAAQLLADRLNAATEIGRPNT